MEDNDNIYLTTEQCVTATATVTDQDLRYPPTPPEFINCYTSNSPTALPEIFSNDIAAVNFYFPDRPEAGRYYDARPEPNLVEQIQFELQEVLFSNDDAIYTTVEPNLVDQMELELQEVLFSNDDAIITTVEPRITKSLSDVVNSDSSEVTNLPETPEAEVGRNYGRRPQLRHGRWSKAEQISFSMGLNKYGYGNWQKIASEFVPTRTHIQVGSHAQKHLNHHHNRRNGKSCSSRSSIFDITIVDSHTKAPAVQPPSPPDHQQFTVTNYHPPPDHQRN